MKNKLVFFMIVAVAFMGIFMGCDDSDTSPTIYNIQFDLQGRADDLSTETVEKGAMVTKPGDPTSEKYDFIHWYTGETDYEDGYNFDTPVTGDLVLIALWKVKDSLTKFTVNFYIGDSAAPKPADQEVADGDTVPQPLVDPEKEGYTFAYWYYTNEEEAFDFSIPITANITLNARWEDDASGPWLWMTFDDKKETNTGHPGGTPIGKSSINLAKEKNEDGETVYAVSGTILNGFQYPFAGLIAEVNPGHEGYEALLAELRSAKSFSFYISGERNYMVKLPQPNLKGPMEGGDADSSHYTTKTTVQATVTPTKVTLKIPDDFAQPSWGTPEKAFTQDELTQINWQTNDFSGAGSGTSFNFKIWGLELHQE